VDIPNFAECDHPLVKALFNSSDYELVQLFQQHPESGRYFTAIFGRYSPVVYSLIRHSARSPVQADYLFALTWQHILHELGGIELPDATDDPEAPSFSLQAWLINLTAACINQSTLPEVESIHYSLSEASPPLWCYTMQALDRLNPMHRLIVLMAQTFHWSETRIAAYLQAEGENVSAKTVRLHLNEAYRELESALPDDIRAIYLGETSMQAGEASELDALLDINNLDFNPNLTLGE
jgi:hypothetical protein